MSSAFSHVYKTLGFSSIASISLERVNKGNKDIANRKTINKWKMSSEQFVISYKHELRTVSCVAISRCTYFIPVESDRLFENSK